MRRLGIACLVAGVLLDAGGAGRASAALGVVGLLVWLARLCLAVADALAPGPEDVS